MRAGGRRFVCNSRLRSGMPENSPQISALASAQIVMRRPQPAPTAPLELVAAPADPARLWRRRTVAALCLAAGLSTSACLFQKPPRAFIPPPVPARPAASVRKPVPAIAAPPDNLASTDLPDLSQAVPAVAPDFPPPPKPPAAPRRPVVATAPKPAPPAPTETAPAPRIVQILTPEQTREYTRELDDSLERVRRALEVLSRKNLTPEQSADAERIRAFQQLARETREQDLVTAVSHARRADLLAKDLLERLP